MSHSHQHTAGRNHHESHPGTDRSGLSAVLDLDAAALAGPLAAVRTDIAALTDAPVRSILDLGAGTGTGTFALLEQFAGSSAMAVDNSGEMLERLRRRAGELGLSDRVTTRIADLDVDPLELEVLQDYAAQAARTDAIIDRHGLDDRAALPLNTGVRPTLRWVLLHLIEENARGNGHLDILRELADGSTGD